MVRGVGFCLSDLAGGALFGCVPFRQYAEKTCDILDDLAGVLGGQQLRGSRLPDFERPADKLLFSFSHR